MHDYMITYCTETVSQPPKWLPHMNSYSTHLFDANDDSVRQHRSTDIAAGLQETPGICYLIEVTKIHTLVAIAYLLKHLGDENIH